MHDLSDDFTAVVLAGGKNTRFGGNDKAFVHVGDVPMVELIIGRLKSIFKNILVVSNSPGKYCLFEDISVTSDIINDSGPLGGIHAAMTTAATSWIFVVSCDMPGLDTSFISKQLDYFGKLKDVDALIPFIKQAQQLQAIEPLHAVYRSGLACKLEEFLGSSASYSIRAFLRTIRVAYMEVESGQPLHDAFRNINRPEDLL